MLLINLPWDCSHGRLNIVLVIYYTCEGDDWNMKTIKDVLDQYPEEMFVNSSKCKAVCNIVAVIQKHLKEQHRFHNMLNLTTELERKK